jgi:hypothetical protein
MLVLVAGGLLPALLSLSDSPANFPQDVKIIDTAIKSIIIFFKQLFHEL